MITCKGDISDGGPALSKTVSRLFRINHKDVLAIESFPLTLGTCIFTVCIFKNKTIQMRILTVCRFESEITIFFRHESEKIQSKMSSAKLFILKYCHSVCQICFVNLQNGPFLTHIKAKNWNISGMYVPMKHRPAWIWSYMSSSWNEPVPGRVWPMVRDKEMTSRCPTRQLWKEFGKTCEDDILLVLLCTLRIIRVPLTIFFVYSARPWTTTFFLNKRVRQYIVFFTVCGDRSI